MAPGNFTNFEILRIRMLASRGFRKWRQNSCRFRKNSIFHGSLSFSIKLDLVGGWGSPATFLTSSKAPLFSSIWRLFFFRPEILALEADMFQKEQCSVKEQRQQQFKLRVLPVEHHTEAGPLKIEVLGRGFLNCWSFSPQPPILFLQPPSKPCRLLSMSPFSGIFTLYHKGKFLPPWSFLIPCEL